MRRRHAELAGAAAMALVVGTAVVVAGPAPAEAAYPPSATVVIDGSVLVSQNAGCNPTGGTLDVLIVEDNSSDSTTFPITCGVYRGRVTVTARDADPAREVRPRQLDGTLEAIVTMKTGDPRWTTCGSRVKTERLNPAIFEEGLDPWTLSTIVFGCGIGVSVDIGYGQYTEAWLDHIYCVLFYGGEYC